MDDNAFLESLGLVEPAPGNPLSFPELSARVTPTLPNSIIDADEELLKKFENLLWRCIENSETDRAGHIEKVKRYREADRLVAYPEDERLTAEAVSIKVPMTRSRVDLTFSSMFGTLSVVPFFGVEVPSGQEGSVAKHFEEALGQENERAELDVAVQTVLRDALVATLGYIKTAVIYDEEGLPIFQDSSIPMEDVYLYPHNVRDLAQCTLVAHRYFETHGTLMDLAIGEDAVFDLEAVKASTVSRSRETDGNFVDREQYGLPDSNSTMDENREIEVFECYVKHRSKVGASRQMYRVHITRPGWRILRLEKWEDGLPIFPIRSTRESESLYGVSYAAILYDLQYLTDQLFSASIEQDKLSIGPINVVDPLSATWDFLQKRTEEGGKTYIAPNDVLPGRKGDLEQLYYNPTSQQIEQRFRLLQQFADAATIPNIPMQTTRAATEIRYAAAQVTQKEQTMLRCFRRDFARFGEYKKRLYWRYFCAPAFEGSDERFLRYGAIQYGPVQPQEILPLRVTPRGMTTASDKVLQGQAAQILTGQILPILEKTPMYQQAGLWPQVYAMLQYICEVMSINDFARFLGKPPVNDPREQDLSHNAYQSSALLAGLRSGRTQEDLGMQTGGDPMAPQPQGMPTNVPLDPGFKGGN